MDELSGQDFLQEPKIHKPPEFETHLRHGADKLIAKCEVEIAPCNIFASDARDHDMSA